MTPWSQRPQEEANLLNPSFLGLLVWSTAAGYNEAVGAGLPFHLAFVALPVVLHKATRKSLPRSTRTSLAAWLDANAGSRIGLGERTRRLSPFVREAILFGATHGLLQIRDGGQLEPLSRPEELTRYLRRATEEVRDCVKRAEFLGRWFGEAGTPATVSALWGVRP